jgi:beta-glucosidase-like glycosyl hydrolase
MGVNWLFAPVADVNNNPDNPIINIRSFGENPQQVASFVEAYINGAHSDRKNPGAGDRQAFPRAMATPPKTAIWRCRVWTPIAIGSKRWN